MGSTMAMLPALAAAGFDYSALFYALSGLFVLLFCAVSIARGDKGSLFVLFAAPSLVLLAALLPPLNYGNNVGSALQPVGNIAFELVLVFGCALFARASNASPARTFMIGRLTLAVSDLAGSWVGVLIYASADNVIAAQTAGIVLFAACELMLLALVIAFLVSERGKKLGRWSGEANAGVGALTTNGTEAATELTQGGPAAATHAAQPAPAAAARRHLDAIAERYGLSERERDVFALLAEGRTNARIGDDLCIAPGTVNYHTRNIYSKLGVHSRQELIDMSIKPLLHSLRNAVRASYLCLLLLRNTHLERQTLLQRDLRIQSRNRRRMREPELSKNLLRLRLNIRIKPGTHRCIHNYLDCNSCYHIVITIRLTPKRQ